MRGGAKIDIDVNASPIRKIRKVVLGAPTFDVVRHDDKLKGPIKVT